MIFWRVVRSRRSGSVLERSSRSACNDPRLSRCLSTIQKIRQRRPVKLHRPYPIARVEYDGDSIECRLSAASSPQEQKAWLGRCSGRCILAYEPRSGDCNLRTTSHLLGLDNTLHISFDQTKDCSGNFCFFSSSNVGSDRVKAGRQSPPRATVKDQDRLSSIPIIEEQLQGSFIEIHLSSDYERLGEKLKSRTRTAMPRGAQQHQHRRRPRHPKRWFCHLQWQNRICCNPFGRDVVDNWLVYPPPTT